MKKEKFSVPMLAANVITIVAAASLPDATMTLAPVSFWPQIVDPT